MDRHVCFTTFFHETLSRKRIALMLLPSNFGWRQVSFHVDVFGGSWRASPGEPPLEAPLETCCRPCHTAGEPKFGPAELWAAKTGPGVLYNKHYSGDCSGVYSAETRWGNTTGKYDGKTSMEPNLAPKQLDSNGIIFFFEAIFWFKTCFEKQIKCHGNSFK